MTSSSSVQVVPAIQHQGKPEWLDVFLQKTFFGTCEIHEGQRIWLNNYCIDCNLSACGHCIDVGSHAGHKVLKLYRHVYKDVVPLTEMQKHINCLEIQAYKCNRHKVIALNPLPHSGSVARGQPTCDTCKRVLIDKKENHYCCIDCKVQAFSKKTNPTEPPFLAIGPPPQQPRTKRPRKGVPHRASLT